MSGYLLSPAAASDLERIWDYTEDQWGLHQAEAYLRELQRAIERAAANPTVGQSCDEIRENYVKLPAGSHLLFYRVLESGGIEVMRVLHQRMDPDRHL